MLGSTASGLYWMFRYLERSENTARMLEVALRMALTRSSNPVADWEPVLALTGARDDYFAHHDELDVSTLVDYVLRDPGNPSSVRSVLSAGRDAARHVRPALTRELWEATNQCWLSTNEVLARRVREQDMPRVLHTIRQESALVRGSLHGTMMRNDAFNFARIGTFLERADNTARILDARYHVLLPTTFYRGTVVDNVQWEILLRSVAAERGYRWSYPGDVAPGGIAEFLILDRRMPRSLAFCFQEVDENLGYLAEDYGERLECQELGEKLDMACRQRTIEDIFDEGLHEFLRARIADTNRLGACIETDYRFIA